MTAVHSIPLTLIDGTDTDFGRFRGEVVLVVNVASQCGHTPQYAGLEALHNKFREQGFAVLKFLVGRDGAVMARFPRDSPGLARDHRGRPGSRCQILTQGQGPAPKYADQFRPATSSTPGRARRPGPRQVFRVSASGFRRRAGRSAGPGRRFPGVPGRGR